MSLTQIFYTNRDQNCSFIQACKDLSFHKIETTVYGNRLLPVSKTLTSPL